MKERVHCCAVWQKTFALAAAFAYLAPRLHACCRDLTPAAAFARLSPRLHAYRRVFTAITAFAAQLAPRWHAYRRVCTPIAAFARLSPFSYLPPILYAFRTKLTEIKTMTDPLLNSITWNTTV